MLGNGPTGMYDMSEYWKNKGGGFVWTINGNWRSHAYSDLGWMMDDWCSPAHDTDTNTRHQKYDLLLETGIPVITPTAQEGINCFVEYPLKEIVNTFPGLYYGETLSYMVAFAIYCGVKRIDFHGADYTGCKPAERACTEGWVFLAINKGIEVHTNSLSNFMRTEIDGKNIFDETFYGYLPNTLKDKYGLENNRVRQKATIEKEFVSGTEEAFNCSEEESYCCEV